MFSFDGRVRYSECDDQGYLSWEGLLDLFQDCSSLQSELLGVGVDDLKEKRRAWVLNFWQIHVNRFPKLPEKIEVITKPYEIKGFFGLRNFMLRSKEEPKEPVLLTPEEQALEPHMRIHDPYSLAYANSVWTFLDLDTLHPARVTEPWLSAYKTSERIPMDYSSRKIKVPEQLKTLEPITVKRHNLDTNGHMNNAWYVRMAFDALEEAKQGEAGERRQVKELRVEYRKAAYLEDVLYPKVAILPEEQRGVVVLADEEGTPYSVVEVM